MSTLETVPTHQALFETCPGRDFPGLEGIKEAARKEDRTACEGIFDAMPKRSLQPDGIG